MVKQKALDFINQLQPDVDGRITFICHEILDGGLSNTRMVNSAKEKMMTRLMNIFDDNLHGYFIDEVQTTIISMEEIVL